VSKLTNMQIRSQIRNLESARRYAEAHEDYTGAARRQKKLAAYQAELAEREAQGLNPGAESQTVRFGETKRVTH
jgi:hypothetical protein